MNIIREILYIFQSIINFIFHLPEIIFYTFLTLLEKLHGNKIIIFQISSVRQIQFFLPIYLELKKRKNKIVFYLACDYSIPNKIITELDLPRLHFILSSVAKYLYFTDIFLQTEIHGRGPSTAKRIFIGHGQPNKITNWSDENLRSFDYYFLYGDLERSMFEFIMKDKPEKTKHIKLMKVGYPKLDAQINRFYERKKIMNNLGLNPNLKTVIYAPAWDPGGSLRLYGIQVVKELLEIENINVIIKLHPVSLEPRNSPNFEFYTGGKDWKIEFQKFNHYQNFRYIDDDLVNPYLEISDVMVTDFSGVSLEFMVLDRPVIYIDCPEFYNKTLVEWKCDPDISKNDERFNAGRNTGIVIYHLNEIKKAVIDSLHEPNKLSSKRKALMKRFLYNSGHASQVAADTIIHLLNNDEN